ncbi:hypothetical protein L0V05_19065 [Tabrizicola sp. J26]|uniref:hypothetical protein n=1 Tax=Alitabrizicola rongguiensis TaxID=2909234 RepID=UPI001F3A9EBD|nr:hypothetical protein [Tabrizicola rongguiensis]MCF1710915.1 hypothetical protein [Tabrizicola rongguiensis]
MIDLLNYLLIGLLPFWTAFFTFLAALSWPVSIIVVAILFRAPIKNAIDRIQRLSGSGFEVGLSAKQENALDNRSELREVLESLDPNVLRSVPQETIESSLRADLDKVSEEKRQSLLLTALAKSRLESAFNLAYANIFGSQIHLLRQLINRGGHVSQDELEREFAVLQSENSTFLDWTLSKYLEYLHFYNFVSKDEDGISITDFGREFLSYLSRMGLSEERLN